MVRFLVTFLIVAVLSPATAQTTPLGNDRLAALATRYFDEAWRLDPPSATQIGVHDYDARLGDYSAAGYAARVASDRHSLAELEAIDPATLGADAGYDAQILAAHLRREILMLDTLQNWKHDPALYARAASNAIYSLVSRDFAPLSERLQSIVARERAIPAMLAAGRANITTVDATTAGIARQDIAGSIVFFSTSLPLAIGDGAEANARAAFTAANATVIAALKEYLAALDAGPFARPTGTFAIGADAYSQLLQDQELAPISLTDYERVGERALAETKAQFIAVAKTIDPTRSPAAVATALGADHPAADALLSKATSDLRDLRAFVLDHHIVTLPPDDVVTVKETPAFARSTTFASMDSPGPLETRAKDAYYYVTPVDPSWSAARREQHLAFFNNAYFPIVSAHEVMPGHYVNFALDKHQELSLIRKVLWSPSFAEGWAHYDEQMIVDEGWGGGDPRVRLAQLQGALLRECRYLVGLREHTQHLGVDAATSFFEENAFVGQEPAHREALRGTNDPLYGYYTLGKLELLKLRDDYKKSRGKAYTLQAFHDDLLAHGDPPIAIVRKILLGADDDGKLL